MSQFAPVGLRVPSGFEQLLESLAKEILRAQPTDIITFAAEYFKRKVAQRDERYNQFMDSDVVSNLGQVGGTTIPSSTTEDTSHQTVASLSEDKSTSQAAVTSTRIQRQDSMGPLASPPPCSDDESDPNSEVALSEPDAEQEPDATHSGDNADADSDLNTTEDDTGSQPDAEMNKDMPRSDAIEDKLSLPETEPSQPAEDEESPPQIPNADLAEELHQTTSGALLDQELSTAEPDLDEPSDLDRSSPNPELDNDEEENQLEEAEPDLEDQEAEKDAEDQDTTGPPEEGDDQ